MSQRLIRKTTHRIPLFRSADGRLFYLPMGAEDGDGKDADKDADKGADAGSSDDGDTGSDGADADKDDDKDAGTTVSAEEHAKVVARMKAADKRASDAEAKVAEAARKEKTDLENAQADLKKEKDRADAAEKAKNDLAIKVAFLGSNTHTWHNPDRALALADLSEVTIDEDGKVDKKALKAAIDALAKSDSYLLKSGDASGDDDKGESKGKSGESVGSGKGKDKDKIDRPTLQGKFPALATRQ